MIVVHEIVTDTQTPPHTPAFLKVRRLLWTTLCLWLYVLCIGLPWDCLSLIDSVNTTST